MEYTGDRLCLDYNEIVPVVMTKAVYDQLKYRNKITVHGIGGNGRKILVEYESLPDKYRAAVKESYGDPYVMAAHTPMLNALEWNSQAEAYYLGYVLPNGDKLPAPHVKRYTTNVSWLDMLVRMTMNRANLKRELNMSIMTFWDVACALIKVKQVSLPSNAKRLKEKVRDWHPSTLREPQGEQFKSAETQWDTLIERHKFGNQNSAKIADEVSEALLKQLLAARNKHDDTIVCKIYNEWAAENNRPKIVPATVRYRRKMWSAELMLEREGLGAMSTKLSKQIKRQRPSAPLLFVGSDDNVLDLYFVAGENKWYRPVLYVVKDNYNDYPLGYAWGDTVTIELIKEAYRNAMRHVMELTGGAYCWRQVQTDRWGISGKNTTELEKFYQSMGVFTPAALKNAQSKYIEQSFGTTWHQALKLMFPDNYSGHNIGAKQQLNRDRLNPSNFPDIREAEAKITAFIHTLRHWRGADGGPSKQETWLEAFENNEKSQAKLLTTEQRLQIFGVRHEYPNRISAAGISPTLKLSTGKTERITYELSQAQILRHIGKEVAIIYDPHNLSEVLVTDDRGLRFVAHEYGRVKSAIADYEEGDKGRIDALQAEKKTLLPTIQGFVEQRRAVLDRARIDAESRINGGVMMKEIAQRDQRVLGAGQPSTNGVNVLGQAQDDTENTLEEGGVRAEIGENETVKKVLKPLKSVKISIYDEM